MDKSTNINKYIETFISENKSLVRQKTPSVIQNMSSNNNSNSISLNHVGDNNSSKHKDDCLKHLSPNTIISGVIVNIIYDDYTKKKQAVIITIKELLSIVSNDTHPMSMPMDYTTKLDMKSLIITGRVDHNEIYDRQLVHLNEIIDSNIVIGNEITAMITIIDIQEAIVHLTLMNSLIKGKKQMFIKGSDYLLNIPFNLGMSIRHESEERNESYLSNKIAKYNINQYGSQSSAIGGKMPSLNYEVLRKIQNYDWSDEYISKGDYFVQKGLFILAIENYDEAEKLDPLNTEIYVKKGNACLKLDDVKKAVSCFKNCLKIDPNNKESRDYIERIYRGTNTNTNSSTSTQKRMQLTYYHNGNDIEFLNKKRNHD